MAGRQNVGTVALMLTADAAGVSRGVAQASAQLQKLAQVAKSLPLALGGSGAAAGVRPLPFGALRFGGLGSVRAGSPGLAAGPAGRAAGGSGLSSAVAGLAGLAAPFAVGGGVAAVAAGGLAATRVVHGLADGFTAAARRSAELALEVETAGTALAVLTGTADRGQKLLASLQKLGVETPFKSRELIDQSKLLSSYGVRTQDLVKTLRQLGDVSSGTGVELNRLSLAYGQVISKGRFQATELKQFTEAGVGVMDFARTAGMTSRQFLAAMEDGKIGADVVVRTFDRLTSRGGRFSGMMDQLARTVTGRLTAIAERAELVGGKIAGGLFTGLGVGPTLGALDRVLGRIDLERLAKWSERIGQGLRPLAAGLGAGFKLAGESFDRLFGAARWDDLKGGIKAFAVEGTVVFAELARSVEMTVLQVRQLGHILSGPQGGALLGGLAKVLGRDDVAAGFLRGGALAGNMGGDPEIQRQIDALRRMNPREEANRAFAQMDAAMKAARQQDAIRGGFAGLGAADKERRVLAEDLTNRLGRLAELVGNKLAPGFSELADGAVSAGRAFKVSAFGQFMNTRAALGVGQLTGAVGAKEAGFGLFAAYKELEAKFLPKLNEPQTPGFFAASGSREAQAAVNAAIAASRRAVGGDVQRQIKAVLDAAYEEQVRTRKAMEDAVPVLQGMNIELKNMKGVGY